MDIYLQIVLNPATHDLSYDPEKEARRDGLGDVVSGGRVEKVATLVGSDYEPNDEIGSKRTGFLYITDVPNATAQKIKRMVVDHTGFVPKEFTVPNNVYNLMLANPTKRGPMFDTVGFQLISTGVDSVVLRGDVRIELLKHKFGAKLSDMATPARQQLLLDKYLTMTWTQAKTFLRHKPANRVIVDGDLDG